MGISALHHDSTVALLDDSGNIINAAKEESFTGIRGDKSWPVNAIEWSIKDAQDRGYPINDTQLTYSYYENPWIRFKRRVFEKPGSFSKLITDAHKPESFIKNIKFGDHHKSHAYYAIKTSPYTKGNYIICDGVGENKSISWGIFTNNSVDEVGSIKYPNSLGILFSAFMNAISLKPNRDEPTIYELIKNGKVDKNILDIINNKIIEKTDKSFHFKLNINKHGVINSLFGDDISINRIPDLFFTLNVICIDLIKHIYENNIDNKDLPLVFSGGIANNLHISSSLKNELSVCQLWIPPYPGNGGSAIGAALHQIPNLKLINHHTHYHGPIIDDAIKISPMLLKNVSHRLDNGEVVGWIQGPAEFSMNGLGHRMLLADPRNKKACEKMCSINNKTTDCVDTIAVMSEMINMYFEIENDDVSYLTGMFAGRLRNDILYNGISHNKPRVLSIPPSLDSFRSLLITWSNHNTNCDILACNNLTQFNKTSDIIWSTRQQIMKLLLDTQLDALVIGNRIYYKTAQPGIDDEESNIITEYDDYTIGTFNELI